MKKQSNPYPPKGAIKPPPPPAPPLYGFTLKWEMQYSKKG